MALDISPAMSVITTDFTFVATIEVVGIWDLNP
jgi:dTDP-4-amino-4,6-dideoxygalactose transaminase